MNILIFFSKGAVHFYLDDEALLRAGVPGTVVDLADLALVMALLLVYLPDLALEAPALIAVVLPIDSLVLFFIKIVAASII